MGYVAHDQRPLNIIRHFLNFGFIKLRPMGFISFPHLRPFWVPQLAPLVLPVAVVAHRHGALARKASVAAVSELTVRGRYIPFLDKFLIYLIGYSDLRSCVVCPPVHSTPKLLVGLLD